MTQERQTKLCRTCYEPIDQRAKKCPYCRMQQTRWAIAFHPAVVAAAVLVCLLLLAALAFGLMGPLRKGEDFAKHQGEVEVLKSEMLYDALEDHRIVGVVGELKNNSDIPWERVQIEVQFMDQEGRLIDTVTDVLFSGEIRPGATRFFRASQPAYLPKERYASYEVRVTGARDARSFW